MDLALAQNITGLCCAHHLDGGHIRDEMRNRAYVPILQSHTFDQK
jgi:hypothetical protein